jgi:predicted Zn-dependent peptidase
MLQHLPTLRYTLLPILTSDASILKNGYQVLRDWAKNIMLEQEEIDKERGIILKEKRLRQNAEKIVTAFDKLVQLSIKCELGDEDEQKDKVQRLE